MATTKRFHKFYKVQVKGDDTFEPVEYKQLSEHSSFCSSCGTPRKGISQLPDIAVKKIYKRCAIYGISHFRAVPVDAISNHLLNILSEFINVSDYLMLGNLYDSNNNLVEEYRTFLPRYYLLVRGSTFYERKCEECNTRIYNYYRDPYLPLSMNDCPIPLFGNLGAGFVVSTEIGLHLKSLKLPCLSIWPLKIHKELPQNVNIPLYNTFF